jgi:hypothetical protein
MTIPKRTIRGVQEIRTLSGNVDRIARHYMPYMKITCLEMEKARRGKEREIAMHRVKDIDARFMEIEAEKAALLQAIDEDNRGKHAGAGSKSAAGRSTGAFKIRY